MDYPTWDQVETAGRERLGTWIRFLPSVGTSALGCQREQFDKVLDTESATMVRIMERFGKLGGWTPALSKKIGWR